MVYVGVDLHRKRSHVVALDPAGEVVLSWRIGNAPVEYLRIFGELEPQPIKVVFEATYGWSWFADLLADVGRHGSPSSGVIVTVVTRRAGPAFCGRLAWRPARPARV